MVYVARTRVKQFYITRVIIIIIIRYIILSSDRIAWVFHLGTCRINSIIIVPNNTIVDFTHVTPLGNITLYFYVVSLMWIKEYFWFFDLGFPSKLFLLISIHYNIITNLLFHFLEDDCFEWHHMILVLGSCYYYYLLIRIIIIHNIHKLYL